MHYITRSEKVVVAEPDRAILEMIQLRLGVAGYDTSTVRTAGLLLEFLQGFRPAAVLMDMGLPDQDGFELLAELRRRTAAHPVPIIVMSRRLAPDDVRRATSLGARDCLAKPFSGAEVVERVARVLRRQSAPPQAPAQKIAWI